MYRRPDCEPDTTLELTQSATRMWCYPTDLEHCCIYRVPERLRRVNPEAYTPQLVLIGPLAHSLRSEALKSRRDITNTKFMGYLNMDEHKKIYLEEFEQNVNEGKEIIEGCRKMIKANEDIVRASYSESTSWIESQDFVEMILFDSVFIIQHIRKIDDYYNAPSAKKTGDIMVDDPCLRITVKEDLMLLENQLPYFILEKLFDSIAPRPNQTFRNLILDYFGLKDNIIDYSTIRHFTDLLRRVRVDTVGSEQPSKTICRYIAELFRCDCMETHGSRESTKTKNLKHMYNAEKLYGAGIEFEAMKNEFSIDVRFEKDCLKNGYLKIPSLSIEDDMELILRNIMALEQCHYPFQTDVCNFVSFLDLLIDSDKDVDLLMEKGILSNCIGEQRAVVELVNKLSLGIIEGKSKYSDIAYEVNAYYESRWNRTRAVLCRKYFANLWTGTAAVAAALLLAMTLIQTVASVIQAKQN